MSTELTEQDWQILTEPKMFDEEQAEYGIGGEFGWIHVVRSLKYKLRNALLGSTICTVDQPEDKLQTRRLPEYYNCKKLQYPSRHSELVVTDWLEDFNSKLQKPTGVCGTHNALYLEAKKHIANGVDAETVAIAVDHFSAHFLMFTEFMNEFRERCKNISSVVRGQILRQTRHEGTAWLLRDSKAQLLPKHYPRRIAYKLRYNPGPATGA